MPDYYSVPFLVWWNDSDAAFKAKHEGDEECARAAWNAALSAALEAVPGGDTCRPAEVADAIRALIVGE